MLEVYDGVGDALVHEQMCQGTVLTHPMRMVCLMYHDNLGMRLEACQHLLGALAIGDKEELHLGRASSQQRQVVLVAEAHKHGVGVFLARPCRSIHDERYAFGALGRQGAATIQVVGAQVGIQHAALAEAAANDHRHLVATDVAHGVGGAAHWGVVVKSAGLHGLYQGMYGMCRHILHQRFGYGNLRFGSLAQRYADGVAQPVVE